MDLTAHYVPTSFKLGESIDICGSKIINDFNKNTKNVVVGTAGSGKSVLLRKIFIDLIESPLDIIPILVELRLLITPDRNSSISEYIYKTLYDIDNNLTQEQLNTTLKQGRFFILLDGFDEIDFEEKETYEREINNLSDKYPNLIIVVSSRPDDCFSSWDGFYVYHALPLNKEQSIDLISRIEYDLTVKKKFIKELKEGLYEKHEDFLSNPLLLTMMLLTYEQLAEIPEKIHIFYEQAFDTLYHKHDALKSLYKRKSYAGLPIDDFKKIFSAFCIVTYSDRKMSFNYDEIITYLDKAIKVEGFDVQSIDFFNDLVKSVCIIQKDGNIFTFSHRSFQEYFTAYFISKSQSIDLLKVLNKISRGVFRDNIISMLFELNNEQIETQWIIPQLEHIIKTISKIETNNDVIRFLSMLYSGFSFHDTSIAFSLENKELLGSFASWLHRLYPDESKKIFPEWSKENRDVHEEEQKLKEEHDFKIFSDNLNIEDPHKTIAFSELPTNIEWLSDTDIPSHIEKRFDFFVHLHLLLTKKYLNKKADLISLLLQ